LFHKVKFIVYIKIITDKDYIYCETKKKNTFKNTFNKILALQYRNEKKRLNSCDK